MLINWITVLIASTYVAQAENTIPKEYVQQDQHTSFFVFGYGSQSLISHCHLNWAPGAARCYLEFENSKKERTNIFFRYEDLQKIQPSLIKALKNLHARMLREHPVTGWNKYIYLFREHDYEILENLITQIEKESLSGRFLMPHKPRDVESISSSFLVDEIFKIFDLLFMPYELR